jgi:hypothetical protein
VTATDAFGQVSAFTFANGVGTTRQFGKRTAMEVNAPLTIEPQDLTASLSAIAAA